MELKQPPGRWIRSPLRFVSALLFLSAIIYGQSFLIVQCWQQFWISSSVLFQSQWRKFLQLFGDDDYYLYVWDASAELSTEIQPPLSISFVGCVLSILVPFWGAGSIFVFMDYYSWPKWILKYKIQPGTNEPVDFQKVIQTAKVVLINQWFLTVPLLHINYYVKKMNHTMPDFSELPTLQRLFFDLTVFLVIDEVGLYYVHRLQHHPKLYAAVHKKHHEWNAPIAIVFTYSTQMEYLMTLLPVNIGPHIMNPHIVTLWIWYALVHLRGIKNHSGYHFPWVMWPSAHAHDFHHMTSNSCFGKSLVLDRLHGTDKAFRVYMARKKETEEQERLTQISNKLK